MNELIEMLYYKTLNKDILKNKIKSYNNVNFIHACSREHLKLAKFLLEQGFVEDQVKSLDYIAFRTACMEDNLKVVKFLLHQGFVEEQVKSLERHKYRFYKIGYDNLVKLGLV